MESYLKDSICGYGFARSILPQLAKSTDCEGRVGRMENRHLPARLCRQPCAVGSHQTLVEWFPRNIFLIPSMLFKTLLHFLQSNLLPCLLFLLMCPVLSVNKT